MSTSRDKKIKSVVFNHALAEQHISAEQHIRDLNRQEMWAGQKGEGKTVGVVQRLHQLLNKPDDKNTPKVAEITEKELEELYRPMNEYFSINENTNNFKRSPVTASGTGGSGGSNNINYLPLQPTSNQSGYWDNQQAPYSYHWETYAPNTSYPQRQSSQVQQQKQDELKKQEFKPEDYKGKFCAIVTLTHRGVELRGVLFVKKCGHWKLCGYNGDKLAGGTSGSFESELKEGTLNITVHQTIYTDAPQESSEDDLEII